jgi:tetratricopeptide (TPR) repeat protein
MNHIALLLKDVFLGQKTGRLMWRTPQDQRAFFFQDGVLLYAKTDVPGEALLDILIKQGRISPEQADQLGIQAPTAKSLGEELLQKGLIDRDAFFGALMAQAGESLLNAFDSTEALITFEETPPYSAKGLESNLSLPRLIAQGVRRMPYDPSLRAFAEAMIPVMRGETFVEYLEEGEKKLLALINGRSDGKALEEASGLDPQFFWKTIFLFFCLDLIDLRPAAKAQPEAGTDQPGSSAQDLLAEVQVMREAMGSIDNYQLLNIPHDASVDEIKKAYFELARKFHPDTFGGDLTPEARQSIFEVFNALTRAYQSLTAKARKKSGTTIGTDTDIHAHVRLAEERAVGKERADILYRKGQKLYDEEKYGGAAAMFQEAARLDAQNANYFLWLARSEAKVPTLVKKAEMDYLQASKLDPENPEPLVGLGMLYKKEGLLSLATKQFEKAGELDPSHPVIRREIGPVTKREKKGLFARKR